MSKSREVQSLKTGMTIPTLFRILFFTKGPRQGSGLMVPLHGVPRCALAVSDCVPSGAKLRHAKPLCKIMFQIDCSAASDFVGGLNDSTYFASGSTTSV